IASHVKETGGWRHRELTHHEDPSQVQEDASSTAACVAALSALLSEAKKTNQQLEIELVGEMEKSIVSGFRWLTDHPSLWKGSRSPETDIVDSALVLELLSSPLARSAMITLITDLDSVLLELRGRLIGVALNRGWPAAVGEKDISLAATISA